MEIWESQLRQHPQGASGSVEEAPTREEGHITNGLCEQASSSCMPRDSSCGSPRVPPHETIPGALGRDDSPPRSRVGIFECRSQCSDRSRSRARSNTPRTALAAGEDEGSIDYGGNDEDAHIEDHVDDSHVHGVEARDDRARAVSPSPSQGPCILKAATGVRHGPLDSAEVEKKCYSHGHRPPFKVPALSSGRRVTVRR